MEKKFKCQSCGHIFTADTNQYVTCPKCDSDNVTIVKKKSPLILIGIIIVAVFVLAVGAVLAYKLQNKEKSTYNTPILEDEQLTEDNTLMTEEKIEELIANVLPEQIEFTSVGTPHYDESSSTYSLKVAAKIPTGTTVLYEVSDITNGKVIASNTSGAFMGLKPIAVDTSNPESAYNVKAKAMKGAECIDSISQMVSGFTPAVTVSTPMTTSELQTLINNKDIVALSNNPKIAHHVDIECRGDLGDAIPPTGLTQIVSHIKMGAWESVKVVSVGLDSQNCINKAVITPILPNE